MGSPANRFRQTITYALLTGRDSFGKPTMGSQSTAAARVQPSRKMVKDANGNDAVSSFVVYTDAALTIFHRVWFPDEDTSDFNKARRPIAIDTYVDGAGVSVYRKVWF
jgi:hypothetical protein